MNDLENSSGDPTQPALIYPDYKSTVLRAPQRSRVSLSHTRAESTAPVFGDAELGDNEHDLTVQHAGAPAGQKIVVHGRVTDKRGRPAACSLVEIWQANAAGRYIHKNDQGVAPLDPNFTGAGRALTDAQGCYRFVTIRPGAYPWGNHHNAWRPAHIHFSLFGNAFVSRLITQMYFPGDPLFAFDPIFNSIPDEKARERLIARYTPEVDIPGEALSYRFDIVLCGPRETPGQA